jgi:hypothetical protein
MTHPQAPYGPNYKSKNKTLKGEGVGARSLTCNTSWEKGVLELWDGTKKNDKQSIIHTDLHKTKQVG